MTIKMNSTRFLLIKMPWLEDESFAWRIYQKYSTRRNPYDDTLIDNFKQLLPKFELLHYDPREFPNASLNYFIKLSNMKFYKWNLNLHKDH